MRGRLVKVLLFLLVFLGLAVFGVQWRAHAREQAAEAAFPAEGQIIDVDGVPVHAVVMGDGPDLILIHGASGNTRDFTFALAPILAQDYRVTIFDRPGLGWTGRADARYAGAFTSDAESPFEQAELLQGAARQLGIDRAIVVGQSYGATVAWAWGLSAPEMTAGILSLAGVANPWPGKLSLIHRVNASPLGGALFVPLLTAFAPSSSVEATLDSIFAPDHAPEGYLNHVGAGLTLRRESMRANARQVTTLRPHIVEISKRYGELLMPVEILHGDADTIVPLQIHSITLPEQIANANLTILPGAGHMPQHTHQDEVLAAIGRLADRSGLR